MMVLESHVGRLSLVVAFFLNYPVPSRRVSMKRRYFTTTCTASVYLLKKMLLDFQSAAQRSSVITIVHGLRPQNVEFRTTVGDKGYHTSLETLFPLLCFFVR